jgi:hypothetical protein
MSRSPDPDWPPMNEKTKSVDLPKRIHALLRKAAKRRDMEPDALAGKIIEAYFTRGDGLNLSVKAGQRFHCGKFPEIEVCITRIVGGWLDLVDMNTGLHLIQLDATDWESFAKAFKLTPKDSPPAKRLKPCNDAG